MIASILRPRALVALLDIAVVVGTACTAREAEGSSIDEVTRLEATLPFLEELRVQAFRDQDWCKNIQYVRGAFSETESPTTCNLFEAIRVEYFDDRARSDFDRVAKVFRAVGFRPWYVNVVYDDEGRVAEAWFELGCPGCESGMYTFSASGTWNDPDWFSMSERVTNEWRWSEE